jgi:hypothetical protein
MKSIDLRKELNHLYNPSAKKVEVVDVPSLQFLMLDGVIEPGHGPSDSPLFEQNLNAMYGAAYTLKFMFKQRPVDPVDYPVMALEGLWWVENGSFQITVKDNWCYTLMILVPELVSQDDFQHGLETLRKKRGDLVEFSHLRLASFTEGLCVQTLHLGPYATEMDTIAKMDAFAAQRGFHMHGKHHEIYLGDPRKAAPEKLKTILRHPVTEGA